MREPADLVKSSVSTITVSVDGQTVFVPLQENAPTNARVWRHEHDGISFSFSEGSVGILAEEGNQPSFDVRQNRSSIYLNEMSVIKVEVGEINPVTGGSAELIVI